MSEGLDVNQISKSRLPKFSTMEIFSQEILSYGECPTRCSMFNGIPGLYPIDASGVTKVSQRPLGVG